jgi:hypothetical protein
MEEQIEEKTTKYHKLIKSKLRSTALVTIVLVLGLAFFLLLVTRKAQEVKLNRQLVNQTNRLEDKSRQAEQLLDKYQDQDSQILKLYPNERTIVDFVSAVEDIGNLLSTDIQLSFDSDKVKKDNNQYPYLSYTVRFTTDLNGLLTFLDRIEEMPYLTDLMLIQGEKLSALTSSGRYVLKANVYIAEPFSVK